jgi:alpha/beta superfamily hydrolase
MPCVIYLHGNSSSRTEAINAVNVLLPMDMTVFSFDFSGCGKSEGDWVTLGFKE